MNVKEYIESGILEAHIFDELNSGKIEKPVAIAVNCPQVKKELLEIKQALERYAISHSTMPSSSIKPLLLATIDYFESLDEEDEQALPPVLTKRLLIADFALWVEKEEMFAPEDFTGTYAKIIGYTPKVTTAIVWIKDISPMEIHHNEYEKFLVLEGSCIVSIENKPHNLSAGDFLSIPLHKEHNIRVTSSIPCKVILQRVAA